MGACVPGSFLTTLSAVRDVRLGVCGGGAGGEGAPRVVDCTSISLSLARALSLSLSLSLCVCVCVQGTRIFTHNTVRTAYLC